MRYRLDHFYKNCQTEAGKKRMTMKAVTNAIGIEYYRLNSWRKGRPDLLEVICLCELFDCTVEDLLR